MSDLGCCWFEITGRLIRPDAGTCNEKELLTLTEPTKERGGTQVETRGVRSRNLQAGLPISPKQRQ